MKPLYATRFATYFATSDATSDATRFAATFDATLRATRISDHPTSDHITALLERAKEAAR